MVNPAPRLARTFGEALMIIPPLALGLTWAGIVLVALIDNSLVDRHKLWIDKVMILLLMGCVACFGLGMLAFAAARGGRRRPPSE